DLELERVAAAVPDGALDHSREDLVLRLSRREGAEVVLSDQQVGRLGEPLLVERPRIPPAPGRPEGRGGTAPEDAVAVAARQCGMAGVKVRLGAVRRGDGDVVRKLGIQRLGNALGRRSALDIDARNLCEGMDAGVRPPGNRKPVPPWEDAVERL